jgi:hypothetical protein
VRPLNYGRGWSASDASTLLDDDGAAQGCACVVPSSGELVTASDAGVFVFSPEDRTAAYGFGGRKQAVHSFRSYLLVAASTSASDGDGGSSMGRTSGALSISQQPQQQQIPSAIPTVTTVTLYDLRARYIGFTMTLAAVAGGGGGGGAVGSAGSSISKPQQPLQRLPSAQALGMGGGQQQQQRVLHVFNEWGVLHVFVLTPAPLQPPPLPSSSSSAAGGLASGVSCGISVIQLTETDTATKVEQLCKMQQYETAAAVATAANFGKENVADIYRQHADALFERGTFVSLKSRLLCTTARLV